MKLSMITSAITLLALAGGAAAQGVAPSFDITGVWNSAGGGTLQIAQVGERATMVFVGPDFAHRYEARYTDPTTIVGRQVRVTRATGCTTSMRQTFTVVSSDFIEVQAVALDSNCDLVKGQVITDSATRIL
jgi:hypothetical protein